MTLIIFRMSMCVTSLHLMLYYRSAKILFQVKKYNLSDNFSEIE